MFCQSCGNKMEEDSKFCDKCGAKVGGGKREEVKVDDKEVVLHVKPKFKLLYESIGFILGILLMTAMFLIPVFAMANESEEGFYIFLAVLAIVIAPVLVIFIITTILRSFQYKKYTYDFYKTKIIYRDSFLNISEKEVKYKNIKEIIYVQGVIQRMFNIGHITLFTNADSGVANGIRIRSVENVKKVYDEIKEIVNS